jgi:archaellum component FlaF (FlaF/FlaG flagellin family)
VPAFQGRPEGEDLNWKLQVSNWTRFNNLEDIFVKDLTTSSIIRVNVGVDGAEANDISQSGTISADGTTVSFDSLASNLVPGDTNNAFDVFVASYGGNWVMTR